MSIALREKRRMKFKRVVLKISGEALAGGKHTGYDFDFVSSVVQAVKKCMAEGVQVGIVIGGGNFWRGVKDGAGHVERVSADRMGMLATCMNCLAVADVFRQNGVPASVQTSVDIQGVGERYDTLKSIRLMEEGNVVLFAGGTGLPFVSTDTAVVLRALETHADAILLAKNVDAVYSADPKKDPSAIRFSEISYGEVLERRLQVMDSTATSMAMDNNIPSVVFALADPENICRVLNGEKVGTLVTV
ncbi:MAG: UMP kinase [Oscillospiraceae bacterium]|nr:UMP kinase [Oscillospiraceae bacterium]